MSFSNSQAFSEGWGLFECDDGMLRIQRLDDPRSVSVEYPEEPLFASDNDAIVFVAECPSSEFLGQRAASFKGGSGSSG